MRIKVLIFCALSLFSLTARAQKILLLGDSLTMNLQNSPVKLFDSPHTVNNKAVGAFNIELVRLALDPNRNTTRFYQALLENQFTRTVNPYSVMVFDLQSNPPDVVSIMIGLRNILDGMSSYKPMSQHVDEYKLLLDRMETFLPARTIVMLNSVLPYDSIAFPDYLRDVLTTNVRTFNQLLQEEVDRRNANNPKLRYTFVNVFDLFLANNRANHALFANENGQMIHPNDAGYRTWKVKINQVLNDVSQGQPTETVYPKIMVNTQHFGGQMNGLAHYQVLVNGVTIGDAYAKPTAETLAFTIPKHLKNIAKIEIYYDNDITTPDYGPQEYDLIVNSVSWGSNTWTPNSPGVVYDVPWDDVAHPGYAHMYWSGKLVFPVFTMPVSMSSSPRSNSTQP